MGTDSLSRFTTVARSVGIVGGTYFFVYVALLFGLALKSVISASAWKTFSAGTWSSPAASVTIAFSKERISGALCCARGS